jgi:hypothetical protein
VSSPYEFLRWILLLSRLGEERKRIADFRLQVADVRYEMWDFSSENPGKARKAFDSVGLVSFSLFSPV